MKTLCTARCAFLQFLLLIIGVTVSAQTASAASISITPTSGPGGLFVISATASGFDAAGVGFTTWFEVNGSFRAQCPAFTANCTIQFTPSLLALGGHTITARNANLESASQTFTVVGPTFRSSPTCGPDGTSVTASGNLWAVDFSVGMYVDGAFTGFSQVVDAAGDFAISFTLPPLSPGRHTMTAWAQGALQQLTDTFTVNCDTDGIIGTVTEVTGTAQLTPQGGTPRPVAVGDAVHLGDVITTGAGSRVLVVFIDDTQFRLASNTTLTIDQYVFDPANVGSSARYSVPAAVFQYLLGLVAKQPDPDVVIDMPLGTLGIRGTELIGRPQPGMPTVTEIHLIDGHISVTPWNTGLTSEFDGPITIRFNGGGILETAGLTQEGYDAIKGEIFPADPPPPPSFTFTGFFPPTAKAPAVNQEKAGSAIPLKFSLGGNQGLGILAGGFPASQQIACGGSVAIGVLQPTAGDLSYDATTDRYSFVWKTEKAWKNTCRKLTVKLSDNSEQTAVFQFK